GLNPHCQRQPRPRKMLSLPGKHCLQRKSGASHPQPRLPEAPVSRRRMAIKSDHWIRRMALEHDMINPFSEKQVRQGVVSYGLSSYGYDLRVADEFKIFTNVNSTIVDPKKFDEKSFVTITSDVCIVP